MSEEHDLFLNKHLRPQHQTFPSPNVACRGSKFIGLFLYQYPVEVPPNVFGNGEKENVVRADYIGNGENVVRTDSRTEPLHQPYNN